MAPGWLPIASKEGKAGKSDEVIFGLYSLGVVTARDEWVSGYSENEVSRKVRYLIDAYHSAVENKTGDKLPIKWTRAVKKDLVKGIRYTYAGEKITEVVYRPFCSKWLYYDKNLNEMRYQTPLIYGEHGQRENISIYFTDAAGRSDFSTLATNAIGELHLCASTDGFQALPLWIYSPDGTRQDNITDWALKQFRAHYADDTLEKRDLFDYVYAVLHHPAYRAKYALNLKAEFPRIPFYANFRQWKAWGRQLVDLHTGYARLEGFPLKRTDTHPVAKPQQSDLGSIDTSGRQEALRLAAPAPKCRLKADKEAGIIEIDSITRLEGIPPAAWQYRLGNRSALEWVLDQYRDFTPKDPTIREKFNLYRFAEHKEAVIVLLGQVCRVSLETVAITQAMPANP